MVGFIYVRWQYFTNITISTALPLHHPGDREDRVADPGGGYIGELNYNSGYIFCVFC